MTSNFLQLMWLDDCNMVSIKWLKGNCCDYFSFYIIRFMASFNLSNAVFQISKSGYKYYTRYKFLKVLFIIHPVVRAVSCVMYIVGV